MPDGKHLFDQHSFLQATLGDNIWRQNQALYLNDGTKIMTRAKGVVELLPPETKKHGVLFSAGIHGNETAPIELLDKLLTECIRGRVTVGRPTLLILGHPEAMKAEQRFIEHNMNRLFMGVHERKAFRGSVDAERADTLELQVKRFAGRYGLIEHYDLHTAIRDSAIERFALKPKREHEKVSMLSESDKKVFVNMGVEALVYQHKPASTFSSYTSRTFKCDAYTVELGKVHRFGENDLARYADTYKCLCQLVSDTEQNKQAQTQENNGLKEFEVCFELINDGDAFELLVSEHAANFKEFEKGALICRSRTAEYSVQNEHEFLIFPNSKVPIGQRAGLMLKRVDRGQAQ